MNYKIIWQFIMNDRALVKASFLSTHLKLKKKNNKKKQTNIQIKFME